MLPLLPIPSEFTLQIDDLVHHGPLRATGPDWMEPILETLRPELFAAASFHGPQTANLAVDAPKEAQLVPKQLPDSSYSLRVAGDRVDVECREPAGLVAALRSLRSLATERGYRCASVTDTPRFAYRGVHLDVGRHFFGSSFVKRLIGVASSLGFNVFHWHLTEDQGWRLPVEAYPRLTDVGAYREQPDGRRYGGSYTAEEIADVVRYAGVHGVLVIPEIELPGHAQAAVAAYPELSCREEPVNVWNRWGVSEEVFCAGKDQVFAFLADVFDEVVRLFPSQYVHIGGDECPKARWKKCPRCQDRRKREGLADENELQSYFVGRAARALEARGRTAIGWDEILEGGLPGGTVVMSWRGTEGGRLAAELGHDVVMTPTSHCYFDHRQIDRDGEIGFPHPDETGRPPVLTLEGVYAFDPTVGLPPSSSERVLGGQANVWTEQMPNEADVEYMVAPRLLAMAEALWSPPGRRSFEDFRGRARAWLARLDAIRWNYARLPELEA
ncbi:MAG: beta-N-acetylhexosaminidase [Spirochaetota bacterium]